jgi:hypothetical protein
MKKGPSGGAPGFDSFQVFADAAVDRHTESAAVRRPCFRSSDLADQRARPVGFCYGRARSYIPKMRVRAPKRR